MQCSKPTADGQPEAISTLPASPGFVNTIKPIEDSGQMIGSNSAATVADLHLRSVVCCDQDPHCTATGRVLNSVTQQVCCNLSQQGGITLKQYRLLRQITDQSYTGGISLRLQLCTGFTGDIPQIDSGQRQSQLLGISASQQQQCIHEAPHAFR
jgi:hypothetical protein